jgi:hypothetical protein
MFLDFWDAVQQEGDRCGVIPTGLLMSASAQNLTRRWK